MCTRAVRNLYTGNFWSKLRLSVGCTGKIEFVVNWNETEVHVLGFCVRFVAARSFCAGIFRFSDRAFGNGVFSFGLSSYVRWKPRNGQLAKMGSFHQRKRPDNKWYAMEVRWGIFIENLSYFLIPSSVRKNSHSNSYSSAMTVNAQDDHLTAGAWAACVWTNCSWQRGQLNKTRVTTTLQTVSFESWNWNGMFLR